MKTLITILYACFVYLFLMIVVSFSSNIISVISDGEKIIYTETKSNENKIVNETQEKIKTQQIIVPFSFDVNIDEELTAEHKMVFLYRQILSTELMDTTSDMLIQLEKRKIKIKYKRIFILYLIKQNLKHISSIKWRIKNIKYQ